MKLSRGGGEDSNHKPYEIQLTKTLMKWKPKSFGSGRKNED